MTLRKIALLTVAAALAAPTLAAAQAFDSKNLFFGAGLSQNDVSGSDTGTGYQVFGGYRFGKIAQNVSLDAEVGYMTTGDMEIKECATVLGNRVCVSADAEAKGLWATGVGRFSLNPQFDLIGRAGLDFGDDDGFMFGVGAGYNVNKQLQLRLELVERDNVSSVQLNFAYQP